MEQEPERNQSTARRIAENIFEWLDSAAISIFVVILLFTFFFGIVGVEGDSMLNTLHNKDKLIITHFNYEPAYGDIVIISRNTGNDENMELDDHNKPLVKRVIGLPGQTLDIHDGSVYIDGEPIKEEYVRNLTLPLSFIEYPVEIPEGYVFVLGDNRMDSHDSRYDDIYLVDTRYILGKAIFRIYPFNQMTTF